MITIDQLLESVDLDFEPGWVTKNVNGGIYVWATRPHYRSGIWFGNESVDSYIAKLKLAEFEGKSSDECIYEVPKKTTGKIEKLPEFDRTEASIYHAERLYSVVNALVDVVNKHADIIQQIGQWGSSKGECLWCETLTKFEPTELKGAKNE